MCNITMTLKSWEWPGNEARTLNAVLLFRSKGATPYTIPTGGTNEIGVWGYIEAYKELMEQVYIYIANLSKLSVCFYRG